MSNIVLANNKKASLLQEQVDYLKTLRLRLFKNDLTPTGANVAADFTEPTDTGYSAPIVNDWADATLNGSNKGETVAPTRFFTFNADGGGETIYGYWFTDPADGSKVVWSQRAAAPFAITAAGQIFAVIPKLQLDTMT